VFMCVCMCVSYQHVPETMGGWICYCFKTCASMSHTLMCSRHPCIYSNESCHTHVWVTSYLCASYVTHAHVFTAPMYIYGCRLINNELSMSPFINETCHTHVWVPSYICASYDTRTKKSYHTHSWVMSHTFRSYATHMCKSRHVYARVMIHVRKSHVANTYVCAARIHMRDMTHSCVCHASCICVPWLMHACDMTHECVWHDSWMCVTWPMNVWHDSQICMTWLVHVCDMTHSCVWHDPCIFVPCLIDMCAMTRACVCMYVTWLMAHTSMTSHGSHINDIYVWAMIKRGSHINEEVFFIIAHK